MFKEQYLLHFSIFIQGQEPKDKSFCLGKEAYRA